MVATGSILRGELLRYRPALITVGVLSVVLNLTVLSGSFYLMMVYDSVLPSHSIPTLIGLFLMVCVIYVFQGLFDLERNRLLASIGAGLEHQLGPRVQLQMGDLALRTGRTTGEGLTPMRDLDQIRGFLTSGGPAALLDLPWIVFFLAVLTALHYWLGVTALVGALLLVGLTVITNRVSRDPSRRLAQLHSVRLAQADSNLRHVEVLTAMGMRQTMLQRWEFANGELLSNQDELSRKANTLATTSKVFRLFLQSAVLTVGALLVLDNKASGGVIFASSLLFGRALAPVDQAIANWKNFAAARAGWERLDALFAQMPLRSEPNVALPRPNLTLRVENLALAPPGGNQLTVHGVNLQLSAGDALGVIGPSGAGKTSLARGLIGVWPARHGAVRLDGAALDQWHPEQLGKSIGYLPQDVELFEGTIAQNIARFSPYADSAAVISAAQEAGVHDMIVQLQHGYETPLGRDGLELSAGQRQRIGLARALFGQPFLIVLDEPNSNLDQVGELALNGAIAAVRARGGIVVVIAHRPALLAETSHVLMMRDGRAEAFGPRDEVLSKVLRNVEQSGLPDRAAANMKVAI